MLARGLVAHANEMGSVTLNARAARPTLTALYSAPADKRTPGAHATACTDWHFSLSSNQQRAVQCADVITTLPANRPRKPKMTGKPSITEIAPRF